MRVVSPFCSIPRLAPAGGGSGWGKQRVLPLLAVRWESACLGLFLALKLLVKEGAPGRDAGGLPGSARE